MTTMLGQRAAADASIGDAPGEQQRLMALGALARSLHETEDVDAVPGVLARHLAGALGATRCGALVREDDGVTLRGRVAEGGRDLNEEIRMPTAGGELDRTIREMLATRRPVPIAAERARARWPRAAMAGFRPGATLGVPMIAAGRDEAIGVVLLSGPSGGGYSATELTFITTSATMAAEAIARHEATAGVRRSMHTAARQNSLLRQGAIAEERLNALVSSGAGLGGLTAAIHELTGRPCAVLDAAQRVRAAAGDGQPAALGRLIAASSGHEREAQRLWRELAGDAPTLVAPSLRADVRHRLLVCPVHADGRHWGHLVLEERGASFGPADRLIARRAVAAIGLVAWQQQRAAEAAGSLIRELVHGSDDPDACARRAGGHGLAIHEPHVVCLLAGRPPNAASRLTATCIAPILDGVAGDVGHAVADLDERVVVLLAMPRHARAHDRVQTAKAILGDVAAAVPEVRMTAAVSTPCHGPQEYPAALAQVRQVDRCLSAADDTAALRIVAVDELGPARLFLAGAGRSGARRFARQTLGALIDGGCAVEDLLATARAFLRRAGSVRAAAADLGVHENTVRYRLRRIRLATGLDVTGSVQDQTAVALALLILGLEEQLPVARRRARERAA